MGTEGQLVGGEGEAEVCAFDADLPPGGCTSKLLNVT